MRISRALVLALPMLVPWTLSAQTSDLTTLLRQGQFADALAKSEQELANHGQDGMLWMDRGFALNGLGRTADALDSLHHALTVSPELLEAAQAGAQIAYRAHRSEAAGFLAQVVRLEPTSAPAHGMLGVLALEGKDCRVALDEFRQAGELAGMDTATERRLAACSAQTGDVAGAIDRLTRLHAGALADDELTQELAALEVEAHRPKQAVELLTPRRATLSAEGLNLLARAYAETDDVSAAVDTYRTAIARAPADEGNYLDLATLSMEHQSPEVALRVLDAGLALNPRAARLLVMRGSVYAQIGKDELAQRDFEQADRLAPDSTWGTLGMGVLLREESNLNEAQRVLERKLQGNANDPVLNFMLADVLIRRGADPGDASFAQAEDLLRRAIAQQPKFAPAHAALGKLELKQGQPQLAVTELETAVALQGKDRTALNQLIAAYRQMGRMGDAERVSAELTRSVAAERAQETERNRVHLTVGAPVTDAKPASAAANSAATAGPQP